MAEAGEKKYHVGLAAGEVGAYVLSPGDPARSALIAEQLDGAREVAFNREFRTFTGKVAGTAVSTVSSGMGGPSLAIGVEELVELGVHTIVRVGTCGAGQKGIRIGDLVIATGAVRGDGTGLGYVPATYPAIADRQVVAALIDAARAAGAPAHAGIVRTIDALYADLRPESLPLGPGLQAEHQVWRRAGVIGNDMETSTLLVVASLRGIRAGTVNLVVDELEAGDIPPPDPAHMRRLIAVAVDAVRRLVEQDAAAPD